MTTTRSRGLGTAVTALVLAVALGACSGTDEPVDPAGSEETVEAGEAAASEHDDADTRFAQMMVVHHEGAIEMAELAVENASSPEVRELAERIAAAQGPEIETMTGWLEAWGEQASDEADMGGMDHGGMDMEGMSQDQAMDSLAELEGTDFDRSFLDLMSAHHRGAIEMAESELDEGTNADALALARTIIADQTAEIAEMEGLLDEL